MSQAPREWPNPTTAEVRLPEGDELEKVTALLTRLLGEGAVPKDVAHLAGALLLAKDGLNWWHTNGVELYHAVFDLTPGSRSLDVFRRYWLDPQRGTPLCLKNRM